MYNTKKFTSIKFREEQTSNAPFYPIADADIEEVYSFSPWLSLKIDDDGML